MFGVSSLPEEIRPDDDESFPSTWTSHQTKGGRHLVGQSGSRTFDILVDGPPFCFV